MVEDSVPPALAKGRRPRHPHIGHKLLAKGRAEFRGGPPACTPPAPGKSIRKGKARLVGRQTAQ